MPVDNTRYTTGAQAIVKYSSDLSDGKGIYVGWNTEPDSSGEFYLLDNYAYGTNGIIPKRTNFTIQFSDIKLYPQWAYSITYDINEGHGGDVPIDNNLYVSGTNKPVEAYVGYKDSHSFVGWGAQVNGCNGFYVSPSPITIGTNNITLYAMYRYQVFYSSYDIYSGSPPVDSNYYRPCEVVNVFPYDNSFSGPWGTTFIGWNEDYYGSGTYYQRGPNPITNFTIGAADAVLYPMWGYTLTYDKNGGEGPDVPPAVYGAGETVTAPCGEGLTKDPYVFIGWNIYQEYPDTITMRKCNDTFSMASYSHTLYATWGHAITYHPNGATNGTVPVDPAGYLPYDAITVLGNIGNLMKTNYKFINWNTNADGYGTSYGANDAFSTYGYNFDLYAMWAPTYLVNYHGNGETGGAVPVDLVRHAAGDSVTVLGNSGNLIKSDYAFDDWDTSPFGNGTIYRASNNFNMGSGDFELYARWLPTYSVTYDGNGKDSGSVPIDNNLYVQSATVNVLGNVNNLALTGYGFWGWNINQVNFTRRYFKPADTFSMVGNDVVLSAIWEAPNNHMVIYDLNGGSGTVPIDPNSHGYGSTDTVTVQNPTGTGLSNGDLHFGGWNTGSDGTGNTYTTSFTMESEDVTLYAQWGYKITYNGNGNDQGTNAPTDTAVHKPWYHASVATQGELTKTGYAFKAWNTESDGSGQYYDPSSYYSNSIYITSDVTLYAIWGHTITYDANGGQWGPADSNVYREGETVTVQEGWGIYYSNGNSFLHWNNQSDDSGTIYYGSQTFDMPNEDVTLYAISYCPYCHTVTYNMGDATGGNPPEDLVAYNCYGGTCPAWIKDNTGNLVKTGYTFAGWSTDPTCSYGVEYSYNGINYIYPYTDMNLYPCWT
jgi:hypothetical protein